MPDHLHIEFFDHPKENAAKSREAGRPIFEDVEMVRIRYVGDTKNVHVAPAHEMYKLGSDGMHVSYAQEFPDHYKAFQEQREFFGEGTPIGELPFINNAKAKELKAINIHTAEALAGLNAGGIKRLGMGGRSLVEQAQVYLDQAKDGALMAKVNEENAGLQRQLDELRAQIAATASAPKAAAETPDGPDGWSDDQLRAYLTEQGAEPRSNANRDKMLAAAKQFMTMEAA